jgi:hypothetical protein
MLALLLGFAFLHRTRADNPAATAFVALNTPFVLGNSTSAFNLHRWNSHHGVDDEYPNITKALQTRPGRWLKPEVNVFPQVPEDSQRPGYADLSFLQKESTMKVFAKFNESMQFWGRNNFDLILALEADKWPTYMGWSHAKTLPDNLDAASELVAAFVAAMINSTAAGGVYVLPRYVEPVNEPDARVSHGANASQIQEYQQLVLTKLRVVASQFGIWKQERDARTSRAPYGRVAASAARDARRWACSRGQFKPSAQ